MNECLIINEGKDHSDPKNFKPDLKMFHFLIKFKDQMELNLVTNIHFYHIEHKLSSEFKYLNEYIAVMCYPLLSVVCAYNIIKNPDCHVSLPCDLFLDAWEKRKICGSTKSCVKTEEFQRNQMLDIFPRLSTCVETSLSIASVDGLGGGEPEVPYPSLAVDVPPLQPGTHLRQAADKPPPDPSQQPETSTRTISELYTSQSYSRLPVAMRSSTTFAKIMDSLDIDEENYEPFEDRTVAHPTTDFETLIHLMKGSLGTGILAMPVAFKSAGLFFGLFATFLVGFICVYSVHILVKSSRTLCKKVKVSSLGFDDIAEVAFFAGPQRTKKFAKSARFLVNFFLVLDLLGCCCVYIVFVARNLKQVIDFNMGKEIDLRICMVAILPLLICMNLIPHLKYLAPFSMVANVLMAAGMGITFYYVLQELPSPMSRPKFSSVQELPIFFGTAIFALEGIGVVMPLENNMKTPEHFLGCFGVLNMGMFFVVMLYANVGFFGYLKYGEATEPSITLNLPDEVLAQSVKLMIAVAIFLTYSLQFHVPLEIIWKGIKHKFPKHPTIGECILRISLVTMTMVIAVLVPHLGPCISLVGAVCLSFLGLTFPAIVEIVVCWEDGLGTAKWILWKNLAIILFGIVGFFTGSYTSILEIIEEQQKHEVG